MFNQAMKIMLLLTAIEQKVKDAHSDGVVTDQEKKKLAAAIVLTVIDILKLFVPEETIDDIVLQLNAWRDEASFMRIEAKEALDAVSNAIDTILPRQD